MKRVLITGGSGFIGRKLVRELLARGDLPTVLTRDVRRARKHLPDRVRVAAWDPHKPGPWCDEVSVVDAIIHLAGESVARRWSDETKKEIERSRVDSTRHLVEAIGRSKKKPSVFVSASATGYYGPRPGSELLDEDSEPGTDFLAGVVQRWEEAARAAEEHGVRSVQVRIGVVFGEGGGPLEQMAKPFRMWVGGPVGDGDQVISWVHRDDVVGIMLFALDHEEVKGPINATSPHAATGDEVAEALGIVLNRPAWLRAREGLLRLRFGEAATILTSGQRVYPKRAAELGYEFQHARLMPALESILGQ